MAAPSETSNLVLTRSPTTVDPATALTPEQIQAFDSYPWLKDRAFLSGLAAMLGSKILSLSREQAIERSIQARAWHIHARTGMLINPAQYQSQVSPSRSVSDPSGASIDEQLIDKMEDIQRRLVRLTTADAPQPSSPAAALSWQQSAPKLPLWVPKSNVASPAQPDGAAGEALYPSKFAAIIEAVTNGKPIPGVQEIPNTVIRAPDVTPFGKMQLPKKPWEKAHPAFQTATAVSHVPGQDLTGKASVIDQFFPDLSDCETYTGGSEDDGVNVDAGNQSHIVSDALASASGGEHGVGEGQGVAKIMGDVADMRREEDALMREG